MKNKIYFDNNATTKLDAEVLHAMQKVYKQPLNSSSNHYFGQVANSIVDNTRNEIKNLLNADNYQVIFTSGGTESNNLALFGLPNHQMITSQIEHQAIHNIAVEKDAYFIKTNKNGVVDVEDFKKKINKLGSANFIVSIMLANNETGAIQPIKELAKITHQYGGLFHSDIVQAVGKINIDLEDLNIDLASISSHKVNGPQGIGALLVRSGIDINNIMYGASQEGGKRPGTLNIAGIAGFGEACKLSTDKIKKYQSVSKLRDSLEKSVQQVAKDDVFVFSNEVERLPNTSLMATKGVDNKTQIINFDLNNICVSIGAACSSGSAKPSRTLQYMEFKEDIINSTIRVSLDSHNTKEEVDQFIKIWDNLYNKTRNNLQQQYG